MGDKKAVHGFRSLRLPHNEDDPIINHRLVDQFQASGQQGRLSVSTARLYNAAADQQSTRSERLGEFGSHAADDLRNSIHEYHIIMSSHARRLGVVTYPEHNRKPVTH